MKNIEVILFLYRDLVFGKAVYINPVLIDKLDHIFCYKGECYYIACYTYPHPSFRTLNIRGSYYHDGINNDICIKYSCNESALIFFEAFKYGIKEVNNKSINDLWISNSRR